jgi:hypothetical protein
MNETPIKDFFNSNCEKMRKSINVFQYWDSGVEGMPEFIRAIYEHNKKVTKKYGFELILIDLKNIKQYISIHERFSDLTVYDQSDYIRWNALHEHGGIWLDTDVIIIGDISKDFLSLDNEIMVDIEFGNLIGCASLFMKKNSIVSKWCIDYVNHEMDTNEKMEWAGIGPYAIRNAYKELSERFLVNSSNKTADGCNFVNWNMKPGINKDSWYMETEEESIYKAKEIMENTNYVMTWTIYRITDRDDITDLCLRDEKSVFTQLMKMSI